MYWRNAWTLPHTQPYFPWTCDEVWTQGHIFVNQRNVLLVKKRNLLYCENIFMNIYDFVYQSNFHPQLSQPQKQHNVTQPQHSCWVGHENDFANPTTETQQQPLWASEQHSLMTTKYSVISNNKQGHNNYNNNNIIISFRSLRLTCIDRN